AARVCGAACPPPRPRPPPPQEAEVHLVLHGGLVGVGPLAVAVPHVQRPVLPHVERGKVHTPPPALVLLVPWNLPQRHREHRGPQRKPDPRMQIGSGSSRCRLCALCASVVNPLLEPRVTATTSGTRTRRRR